jgi:hypothetical protein
MAVETSSWLAVGRSYTVRIGQGDATIALTGDVVWCRLVRTERLARGESRAVYRAGVRFSNLDEEAHRLHGFLEEKAVVEVDRRLQGRFRLRREEAVNVCFERDFRVASLSRTEVVLEADLLLEVGSRYDIELSGDDPDEPVRATVRVSGLEQATGERGEPLFRIRATILHADAGAHRALEGLIRREVTTDAFLGNEASGIFHRADCHHVDPEHRRFGSRRAALDAGMRPGGCCRP